MVRVLGECVFFICLFFVERELVRLGELRLYFVNEVMCVCLGIKS